jgi:hypothetical protein
MYALTPRLWDGDNQLREQEPLCSALLQRLNIRESRHASQDGGVIATLLNQLVEDLLRDNNWVSSNLQVYMIMSDVANRFSISKIG